MSKSLPKIKVDCLDKELSRFGLGGFHQVEMSSDIVAQNVATFLDEGGNYIETARAYGGGASEEKIGRALEGRRDEVVLCSKSGAATAEDAKRDLETTLKNLRTDHIDFYMFHQCDSDRIDQIVAPGGALETFQKAVDEGVIGGLGFSAHWLPTYLDAFDRLPLSMILIWCNVLDCVNFPIIRNEIMPKAREKGILVTGMKPLADGFLYRTVEPAIRSALYLGADIAVCGANNPDYIRQVASAVRQGPADEAAHQACLRESVDLGKYCCRGCGGCTPELMDLFRIEGVFDRQMDDFLPHDPATYALHLRLSRWFQLSQAAIDEYAAAGYDADVLLAKAGGAHCPYGIDLPRKVRIATAKLTGGSPHRV